MRDSYQFGAYIEELLTSRSPRKGGTSQRDRLEPKQRLQAVQKYLDLHYVDIQRHLLQTLQRMDQERPIHYVDKLQYFWRPNVHHRSWRAMIRDLHRTVRENLALKNDEERRVAKAFWFSNFVNMHGPRPSPAAQRVLDKFRKLVDDDKYEISPEQFFQFLDTEFSRCKKDLMRLDVQSIICGMAQTFGVDDEQLFRWLDKHSIPYVLLVPRESGTRGKVYVVGPNNDDSLGSLERYLRRLTRPILRSMKSDSPKTPNRNARARITARSAPSSTRKMSKTAGQSTASGWGSLRTTPISKKRGASSSSSQRIAKGDVPTPW